MSFASYQALTFWKGQGRCQGQFYYLTNLYLTCLYIKFNTKT